MAEAVGKKNIDQEEREKYFAEEDEYIKKKFNFVQNAAHPCTNNNKICKRGNRCVFIGFPADTCVHFIFGNCTHQSCRQTHYEEFAQKYNNYKNEFKEFKQKERQQKAEEAKKQKEAERESQKKQNEANIDIDKQWLDQNTRICPICTYPVEKLNGCDNMYCQKCKQPFNWDQMKVATGAKNEYKIEQAKRNAGKKVPNNLSNDSLQLWVVLTNGKSESHIVQLESKVEELMKQIEERTDIPSGIQRLQYGAKQLNKDIKIKEYGFYNNSSIFLILRLPGGI